MKSSRLTERIYQLESKLSSKQLSSDRERVVRWRLAKLQEKLDFVKGTQTSLETCYPQPTETAPTDSQTPLSEDDNSTPERPFRGRGGRCARGAKWGRPDQPKWREIKARMDPEVLAKWQQSKQDLIAARESGDAEKIAACKATFLAAKAAKREAFAALKAEVTVEANDQKA